MDKPVWDTEIDELLTIIAEKGQMTIEEASRLAGVSIKVVQTWVDFLVEEKVLILDYNFLTPIIRLTPEKKEEIELRKKDSEARAKEAIKKRMGLKGEFFDKARRKGIEAEKIKVLWRRYVDLNEDKLKKEFYEKAKKRGAEEEVETLWKVFLDGFRN